MSHLNNDLIVKELLKILPNHVFWKDTNGIYQGCNKIFAEGLGFSSEEEIVGKTDYDLPIDKKLSDLYRRDDLSVMESQSKLNIEEEQTFTNGKKGYLLTSKVPIFDKEKKVVGILGVYIDITERKIAENELIKSKERAEASSRAKTAFLANMSHDIKTPMTGVVSVADIIARDKEASEKDRQLAKIIFDSAKQVLALFDNCIELSKLEMVEFSSKEEVFSLPQLLQQIDQLFMPRAISKKLDLSISFDAKLPKAIQGQRASIYRIVLNLVGNALKFTEQGNVTIRGFLAEMLNEKQVMLGIEVKDTGIGIPEDKQKVIFERLHRLTPSYEGKVEGHGIGLYIVDQYVKAIGGRIRVKSSVGQGSIFTVLLPVRIADDEVLPEQPIISTMTALPPVSPSLQNFSSPVTEKNNFKTLSDNAPHILLVEDTPMIQFATKSLLNDSGFHVDIAGTGAEAIAATLSHHYDLIYMDIGLPDMQSYDVARAIREHEKTTSTPQTPIIALTGHAAVDVQFFCGQAGMQGVLSKPLFREQAENVWKRYGKNEIVNIPGLTVIDSSSACCEETQLLDIAATVALIGSESKSREMFALLASELTNQFLPNVETFIKQHDHEALRHQLHATLGTLCYVKVPLLNQAILELQRATKSDFQTIEKFYMEVKVQAKRFTDLYQKMKGENRI